MSEDEVDGVVDVFRPLAFLLGLGVTGAYFFFAYGLGWGWNWEMFSYAAAGIVWMFGAVFYVTDSFRELDVPGLKEKCGASWVAAFFGGLTIGFLIFGPSGQTVTVSMISVLAVEVVWALYIFFFVEEYHIH